MAYFIIIELVYISLGVVPLNYKKFIPNAYIYQLSKGKSSSLMPTYTS